MTNYNYKKSQILENKVNIPEINKQILLLKKEFRKYTTGRVSEMYRILSKIVSLKRLTDLRYAPRSLENEKDMKLTAVEIRYVFSYKYFSENSKKLVEDNKIEDKTICFLIWRYGFLRNFAYQDKLVSMYLKNEIRISELGWMNSTEIKNLIDTGNKVLETDRYLISSNKSICSILSRLKQRNVCVSKSKHKQEVINSLENLKRYLLTGK
jgi:hypothetical protein